MLLAKHPEVMLHSPVMVLTFYLFFSSLELLSTFHLSSFLCLTPFQPFVSTIHAVMQHLSPCLLLDLDFM